jgi:hypothetical protein
VDRREIGCSDGDRRKTGSLLPELFALREGDNPIDRLRETAVDRNEITLR